MKICCPDCGSPVIWDGACHTWPGGTRSDGSSPWMSCQSCFSAVLYMCDECDWDYVHGLDPNNPRAAAEEKYRPDWLPELKPGDDPMRLIPKEVRYISD